MDKQAIIAHVQEIVDKLHNLETWQRSAFLEAMRHGLQGEKRLNRYESSTDKDIICYLQSEIMDLTGQKIMPKPSTAAFPDTATPLDYLKAYKAGLEDIRHKLHVAANKCVNPFCIVEITEPLYDRCKCLYKAIIEVSREIVRYEAIQTHGTALHDLMRSNNTAESKHDRIEGKEGYIGD
jgi:hypothetical protein